MFRSMISSRRMTRFSPSFPSGRCTRRGSTEGTCTVAKSSSFLGVVFFRNQGPDIQGFIPDQRERTGRIHGHRCQHRINVLLKITGPQRRPALSSDPRGSPQPPGRSASAPEAGNGCRWNTADSPAHGPALRSAPAAQRP